MRNAVHHVSQKVMLAPQPSPPLAQAWSSRNPSTPSAVLPSPFGSSHFLAQLVTVFTAAALARFQ